MHNSAFGSLFFSFFFGPYLFQSVEYSHNPSSSYVSGWMKGYSLFPLFNKIDLTKKKERKIILIITLFTVLFGGFYDHFYKWHRIFNGMNFIDIPGPFNVFLSSLIFLLFFSCFREWNPSNKYEIIPSNFFHSSGSCSMGIFMLNEFFIYRLMYSRVFSRLHLDWYEMNNIYFGPIMGTTCFFVCWILSLLIKKTPILKHTIY